MSNKKRIRKSEAKSAMKSILEQEHFRVYCGKQSNNFILPNHISPKTEEYIKSCINQILELFFDNNVMEDNTVNTINQEDNDKLSAKIMRLEEELDSLRHQNAILKDLLSTPKKKK